MALYSLVFLEWWSHYPRKLSKHPAFKSYKKQVQILMDEELMTKEEAEKFLLVKVQEYAKSDVAQGEKKYIPHPSTWLNQRRYEDDATEWNTEEHKSKSAQTRFTGQRTDF